MPQGGQGIRKGCARGKPKGDRGNVSLANLPPVLFGLSPRIRAPRPVKIIIRTQDKNIDADYSFSKMDVGTADRPAPSEKIYLTNG